MKWTKQLAIGGILLSFTLHGVAAFADKAEKVDLTPRIEEIYKLRSRWLLTGEAPPRIDNDYLPGSNTARWALTHERGKFNYMKQWTENRGVSIVEAEPKVSAHYLGGNNERARFYVTQSLTISYRYPGETTSNSFGVGTRHILELRKRDDRWLVSTEWYTDPLGDDTEVPDVTPALLPEPLVPVAKSALPMAAAVKGKYDREGAVAYADQYCGLAAGCGNNNRYNPKFRDYNGVGGDCTNYVSQAIRVGGKLSIPIFTRVDGLASHIRWSGAGSVVAQAPFQKLWNKGGQGLIHQLKAGDMIAYQEKGKLEHFGIVTGLDSRGYPLVNSHTADRYHVPFDLGWDRKTVYWLIRMRD